MDTSLSRKALAAVREWPTHYFPLSIPGPHEHDVISLLMGLHSVAGGTQLRSNKRSESKEFPGLGSKFRISVKLRGADNKTQRPPGHRTANHSGHRCSGQQITAATVAANCKSQRPPWQRTAKHRGSRASQQQ